MPLQDFLYDKTKLISQLGIWGRYSQRTPSSPSPSNTNTTAEFTRTKLNALTQTFQQLFQLSLGFSFLTGTKAYDYVTNYFFDPSGNSTYELLINNDFCVGEKTAAEISKEIMSQCQAIVTETLTMHSDLIKQVEVPLCDGYSDVDPAGEQFKRQVGDMVQQVFEDCIINEMQKEERSFLSPSEYWTLIIVLGAISVVAYCLCVGLCTGCVAAGFEHSRDLVNNFLSKKEREKHGEHFSSLVPKNQDTEANTVNAEPERYQCQ